MPGVIFLEHFNCNNFFTGCLLINCVRDNNQGVIKNVNGACARQPVEFEIIARFVRDVKIVRMFHKSQGLLLMIVQM